MAEKLENMLFAVHRTHNMLRNCEDRVFGEYGLTAERYIVLTTIEHLNEPVRVTDVAKYLALSTNSVSTIADRMVKAELLKRVRGKRDRREVYLATTNKARDILKPATLASTKFAQGVFTLAPVSYSDAARLFDALQHGASEYLKQS